MKKAFTLFAMAMLCVASYGQGAVAFRNRVGGLFDAPFYACYGPSLVPAGAVPGMKAQLFMATGGTLIPLSPITTFAATSGPAAAYLKGVDVVIPNSDGSPVILEVRIFDGETWQTSEHYGSSLLFEVTPALPPNPPANLTGLGNSIVFACIPEPSTVAVAGLGLGALFLVRRKRDLSL